jgi:type IV secretory pathway VirB10-like protein
MEQSLTKKIYPNAVRMRPILLKIGVITVLAVIICLMIVLFASLKNKRNVASNRENSTQTLAGNADTVWYQNAESAKPNVITITSANRLNNLAQKNGLPESSRGKEDSSSLKIKDVQPSTAPITSNQLIGEQFYKNASNSNYSSSSSTSISSAPVEDPNQQTQKAAFLQNVANNKDDEYLHSILKNPISHYEVQAGSIIPALLMTGINSDLPGQITAQVKTPVYDSISGRYVLIPQGARMIGVYDSSVVYGQERVLVAWKRIIFPNGKSINLKGMPGVDLSGYAGFHDQVNNHYGKIFGSVILMSILSAGAQLSQPQQSADSNQVPTVNQMIAQSLGTDISNASAMLLRKNISIPPTLEIRPGFEFNVMVTKDMVFPNPYDGD